MKRQESRTASFTITAEPGSKVFVAGTFNQWDPTRHPLRNHAEHGVFQTTLRLPPGRHEYKFVVNGQWHVDPNCPTWVVNDKGSLNSVMTLEG